MKRRIESSRSRPAVWSAGELGIALGLTNLSKRIVFYGAGEVAEIGSRTLQRADLDGQPFDRLVVMSFGNPDKLRAEVLALGVPYYRTTRALD